MTFRITALEPADESKVERLLDATVGGRQQARLGEMVDVLAHPGVVARSEGAVLGVALYGIEDARAELAAITVVEGQRHAGLGSALVEAVIDAAREHGARELWLLTTNDNLDALRFYQRRGFHLAELHVGGIERSRQLKPAIPRVGNYGIPMRDELILARAL